MIKFKTLYTIALFSIYIILLYSCDNQSIIPQEKISSTQKSLYSRLDSFEKKIFSSPNDISKQKAKEDFKNSLHSYFADSLSHRLDSFEVHATQIAVVELGNILAFTATFLDKKGVQYWMEFDYSKNEKKALEANPVYKLLKDMPTNVDTTLNLFYMGDVSYDVISSNRIRIKAIPLPEGLNTDSISKKLNL